MNIIYIVSVVILLVVLYPIYKHTRLVIKSWFEKTSTSIKNTVLTCIDHMPMRNNQLDIFNLLDF